jgi:hypothetical protein
MIPAFAEATNGPATLPVTVLLQPDASTTVKLYAPNGTVNIIGPEPLCADGTTPPLVAVAV